MNTQPEALRLADALESGDCFGVGSSGVVYGWKSDDPTGEAAAELRRLHAEVDRLTEVLRRANDQAEHFERHWYLRGDQIDGLLEALRIAMKYAQPMMEREKQSPSNAQAMVETVMQEETFVKAAIAKATGGGHV